MPAHLALYWSSESCFKLNFILIFSFVTHFNFKFILVWHKPVVSQSFKKNMFFLWRKSWNKKFKYIYVRSYFKLLYTIASIYIFFGMQWFCEKVSEDSGRKTHLMYESMNDVFVEMPWLQRVCWKTSCHKWPKAIKKRCFFSSLLINSFLTTLNISLPCWCKSIDLLWHWK